MSNVTYDSDNMIITVEGLDTVSRALGNLKSKTPAAAKVAINATARQARKVMIMKAKARYAVNAAGQKHLKDLVQRKKATNRSLFAELHIASLRNDLGYFKYSPKSIYTGTNVRNAPDVVKAKVLKASGMKPLTGGHGKSKGFLLEFSNGHVGMVQRVINSHVEHPKTRKGFPRWRNSMGKIEKLETMGSPSAAAMHHTIWPEAEPEVSEFLEMRLAAQVEKVLARAARRHG